MKKTLAKNWSSSPDSGRQRTKNGMVLVQAVAISASFIHFEFCTTYCFVILSLCTAQSLERSFRFERLEDFFLLNWKKINKELWAEEECITLCTNNLARVKLSQQSSTSPPPSVWLIFFAQYSAMIFHQQQLNNRVFFKKITVITSINLNSKSNGPLCTFY